MKPLAAGLLTMPPPPRPEMRRTPLRPRAPRCSPWSTSSMTSRISAPTIARCWMPRFRILQANGSVMIRVAGHTDERGSDEYNLALGQRRAAAVKAYLVQHGIPETRIETVSYGEERVRIAQGVQRERVLAESTLPSSRSPRAGRRYGSHETMDGSSFRFLTLLLASTGCLASKDDIRADSGRSCG